MKALALQVDNDPFESARNAAAALENRLRSAESLGMSHGELEVTLRRDGAELLRCYLQAHLSLRAVGESRRAVVDGADGIERTHVRSTRCALETVFGRVEVARLGYTARGATSLFPLDEELNLPVREMYSHGVREAVARESARGSFEEAAEAVCRTTAAKIAKRQVEELTRRAAVDFDAFYEDRKERAKTSLTPTTSTPLILATDATGCKMRREALRELERREADRDDEDEPVKDRGPFDERPKAAHVARMAQVATVYDIEPHIRRPVDIARAVRPLTGIDDDAPRPPRPQNKRIWASLEQNELSLIVEMFKEAKRRDPDFKRPWVGLVDGDESQLDTMKRVAQSMGVTLVVILDVIHVLQRIWDAGKCFFPDKGKPLAEWVSERFLAVLQGRAVEVAAGIRQSATKRKLAEADREPADAACDYLLKYKEHLKYDEYLRARRIRS